MADINDHWQNLFATHDILSKINQDGYFDITSKQINKVHQSRVMCKMDFIQNVPKIFKSNNLSILAIKNGIYRIAKTKPFFDINLEILENIKPKVFRLPNFIQTLNVNNITSESQAMDAAAASGMLDEIIKEENYLTVRGRHYCSDFNIEIPYYTKNSCLQYNISGVQIEVDGGYESDSVLVLIEAKMGISDNMNMRQLVYPHLHYEAKLQKTVKTYVMFYETGSIYTFIPMFYSNNLATLDYCNAKKFQLIENENSIELDIEALNLPSPNNNAPFPQANDIKKGLYALAKLKDMQPVSKEDLLSEFPIEIRNYDYYYNILRWFNVAEIDAKNKLVSLTELGEAILELSESNRLLAFRNMFYKDELVSFFIKQPNSDPPENLTKLNRISGDTIQRRKNCVLSWHKFFQENT